MNVQDYLKQSMEDPKLTETYDNLKDTDLIIKALMIKSFDDRKTMLSLFSCISCIAIVLSEVNDVDINEILNELNDEFKARIEYFKTKIKSSELH